MSVLHLIFNPDRLPDCLGLLNRGDFVVLMGDAVTCLKEAGRPLLKEALAEGVVGVMGRDFSVPASNASTSSGLSGLRLLDDDELLGLVIRHQLSQTW